MNISGVASVPFLVVELPTTDFKDVHIPMFKDDHF